LTVTASLKSSSFIHSFIHSFSLLWINRQQCNKERYRAHTNAATRATAITWLAATIHSQSSWYVLFIFYPFSEVVFTAHTNADSFLRCLWKRIVFVLTSLTELYSLMCVLR